MLIVLVGGPYSSMALCRTHSRGSRWIFTDNRIRVILTEDLLPRLRQYCILLLSKSWKAGGSAHYIARAINQTCMPRGRQTVCRLRFIYFPHHDLYTWRDMSASLHEQLDGSIILVIICLLEGICLYLRVRVGIWHCMCVVWGVCVCVSIHVCICAHVCMLVWYLVTPLLHAYACLNSPQQNPNWQA